MVVISALGDSGSYTELMRCGVPAGHRTVFLPSLAALLDEAERLKGSPLTEGEVTQIRDGAQAAVVPIDVADATERDRGYPEVDPNDLWASWQALRSPSTP